MDAFEMSNKIITRFVEILRKSAASKISNKAKVARFTYA